MRDEIGFLHLNEANEWPAFPLKPENRLTIDADGSLGLAPLPGGAFAPRGVFLAGPFEVGAGATPWYRLQVFADSVPAGAHIQLYTFSGDGNTPSPLFDPAADNPFTASGWQAAPRDLLDILIPSPPAQRLWIGGVLRG